MTILPAASVCVTCSTKFVSEQQISNFHHANLQNASYTHKLPKFTTSSKISNIINPSLSVHYTVKCVNVDEVTHIVTNEVTLIFTDEVARVMTKEVIPIFIDEITRH